MKNFDLNALGVIEMNRAEMLNIDGGNILKKCVEAVCKAAKAVGNAIVACCEFIWDVLHKEPKIYF